MEVSLIVDLLKNTLSEATKNSTLGVGIFSYFSHIREGFYLSFYSTLSNKNGCLSEREGGEGEGLRAVGESFIILGNFGTLILTSTSASSCC